MNVDTAIQNMLFKEPDAWIKITAELAQENRAASIYRYQQAYGWTVSECNEFLDNIVLAYELLVKGRAA